MTSKKQSFKDIHPFETRKKEASRIRAKYPDRVPVIVEKDPKYKSLPDIDKVKFLVPDELTVGQMIYVIRRRIKLSPEQALFIFVNGSVMPPTAAVLSNVYAEHVDEDGFLYLCYSGESVFGDDFL